ncbi:hypothetical protein LCGC14_1286180 [marine sediment metagenome]|uniref:DNA-directed DNA polymerase family A palm domain-containing protein n=1 Tax=marine sediment metagenome TaxID=412755 RepID=A0A0F9KTT4_9ZZZZ
MILSIDFESRSTVNLPMCGVYRYAEDLTTDLWCMAWAVDDEEPQLWLPGQLPAEEFLDAVHSGAEMRAWNAQFERVLWQYICVPRYDFPEIPLEQWHDTAAEAAAMALPRALGNAANVCGVPYQKDTEGHSLMMRMSRPRSTKGGKIVWWNVPERIQRLGEYCMDDVRAERAMYKVLRRLTANEREVYLLDQRMNERGVLIDVPLVHAAKRITNEGMRRANEELTAITGSQVTSVTQVAEIKMWLGESQGIALDSIRKSIVQDLLGDDDLPSDARTVLELRAEAGKSSVAKLNAMLRAMCEDHRVRGLLLYHGANTGRWAGKIIQVHNFPRGSVEEVEGFIQTVLNGEYDLMDMLYPPLQIISSMLRGMLRASPGRRFVVGDFAQIEARVLAWLAGQDDMVRLFASGGQVYHKAAADAYGLNAEDIVKGTPEYQLGKAAVLGCGYQMGPDTFQRNCAEMWGLEISEETAKRVVGSYRSANEKIVHLWGRLGYAAMDAVRHPGKVYTVNKCRFTKRGGYLWLILPSGRPLAYPSPTIEKRRAPWGDMIDSVMAYSVDGYTKAWRQRSLYGGMLAENIVQALARDLMMESLLRVEKRGYEPLFSVHDEVVSEVDDGVGSVEEFTELMSITPAWAEGLPMAVDTWTGRRYKK